MVALLDRRITSEWPNTSWKITSAHIQGRFTPQLASSIQCSFANETCSALKVRDEICYVFPDTYCAPWFARIAAKTCIYMTAFFNFLIATETRAAFWEDFVRYERSIYQMRDVLCHVRTIWFEQNLYALENRGIISPINVFQNVTKGWYFLSFFFYSMVALKWQQRYGIRLLCVERGTRILFALEF